MDVFVDDETTAIVIDDQSAGGVGRIRRTGPIILCPRSAILGAVADSRLIVGEIILVKHLLHAEEEDSVVRVLADVWIRVLGG